MIVDKGRAGPHTLSLEFDGVKFIFMVDGMPVNYLVSTFGPGANVTIASDPFRAIGTVARVDTPGGSASVSATFDNVVRDATPYDDFQAGSLDPMRWLNLEAIRRVSGGALESSIRRFRISIANDLTLLQPGAVTALQAGSSSERQAGHRTASARRCHVNNPPGEHADVLALLRPGRHRQRLRPRARLGEPRRARPHQAGGSRAAPGFLTRGGRAS